MVLFFFPNEARITNKTRMTISTWNCINFYDEKAKGNLQEGVMYCTSTNAYSKKEFAKLTLDKLWGGVTINISSLDRNDTPCTLSISLGFSDNLTESVVILVVETCCRSKRNYGLISIQLIGDQRLKPRIVPSLTGGQFPQFVVVAFSVRSSGQKYLRHILVFVKMIIYLWNTFP